MIISMFLYFLIFTSEHNYRILTWESEWILRGRYELALQDDEELVWLLIDNKWILRILVVSDFCCIFCIKLFIFLSGRPLAEGVATAGIAARLAGEQGIEAPIIAATAAILGGRMTVAQAMEALMSRPLRAEAE